MRDAPVDPILAKAPSVRMVARARGGSAFRNGGIQLRGDDQDGAEKRNLCLFLVFPWGGIYGLTAQAVAEGHFAVSVRARRRTAVLV